MRYAVWVDDIPGKFQPPKQHALLDQRNLRFVPHILTILAGTTVDFSNSDSLLHNVFSISRAKQFNLGLYPKGRLPMVLFDKPGIVAILCNVHPEMSAYIVVLENPFFAVPDLNGHFVIRDVPAGSRTIRCWSENGKTRERKVVLAEGVVNSLEF